MVSKQAMTDPRPLRGEPLALDLVNTEWVESGHRQDLLADADGTTGWLGEHGFDISRADLDEVRGHLLATREALRLLLEGDQAGDGRARLNAILERGRVIVALGAAGPVWSYEVAAGWQPAWHAAFNYVELLRRWPASRIKACAHPDCILYFLDTSKNGTRRWCDMRTCGNRAKARRHYRRRKAG